MKKAHKSFLLALVILIFIALMVVGVKGWNAFVVPNLGKVSRFSLPLLLGFSFLAGAVSFFAPCAFALFPGYAAFYLGSEEEKKEHPAKLGVMASLGVITFFVLLSLVILIAGNSITQYLKYLAPTVGFIIFILGIVLFVGYTFKTSVIQRVLDRLKSKETRSKRNIYLFGVGYGAVSLGCTLPLLFAMVVVPLATGKIFPVVLSLLTYAVAMGILMVFVTYLVEWSEDRIIKRMVQSTGTIKKLSGLVLVIIGAYLVYYNTVYGMIP